MRHLCRRDLRDDRGSIIIALGAIMILATVAMVGLVAVVNGQAGTRHDNRFSQALHNAESGLDAMVATLKSADKFNSGSQALITSGQNGYQLSKPNTYQVTAIAENTLGDTGSAATTKWSITSIGTAIVAGKTLTRKVVQTVLITHDYTTPLQGTSQLSLPPGSSVSTYIRGDGDATCGETINGSTETSCTSQVIASGITLPLGLGTLGSTTITNIPVGGAPGPAQTGGTLDVQSADLSNFSLLQLDGANAGCLSTNTGPCSTSTVVLDADPAPTLNTNCAVGGTGVALQVGGLNVPLTLPTGNLIFNAALQTNFYQNPPVNVNFCTSLPIIVPTLGTNLNALGLSGVTNLTGLNAAVDLPLGANCGAVNLAAVITANLSCTMNNPSSLIINEVGNQPVYLGTGSAVPTYISALITAPSGNCIINGNVVLYGTLNCDRITYTAGSTLTLYYPTDANLGYDDTKHKDTVLNWNECDRVYTACQ